MQVWTCFAAIQRVHQGARCESEYCGIDCGLSSHAAWPSPVLSVERESVFALQKTDLKTSRDHVYLHHRSRSTGCAAARARPRPDRNRNPDRNPAGTIPRLATAAFGPSGAFEGTWDPITAKFGLWDRGSRSASGASLLVKLVLLHLPCLSPLLLQPCAALRGSYCFHSTLVLRTA